MQLQRSNLKTLLLRRNCARPSLIASSYLTLPDIPLGTTTDPRTADIIRDVAIRSADRDVRGKETSFHRDTETSTRKRGNRCGGLNISKGHPQGNVISFTYKVTIIPGTCISSEKNKKNTRLLMKKISGSSKKNGWLNSEFDTHTTFNMWQSLTILKNDSKFLRKVEKSLRFHTAWTYKRILEHGKLPLRHSRHVNVSEVQSVLHLAWPTAYEETYF